MKVATPLFCALLLCVIFTSCKKETKPQKPELAEQLPEATQTGAFTFGCLLDGEVWLPKHYSNSIINHPTVLGSIWNNLDKNLTIYAKRRGNQQTFPKEDIAVYNYVANYPDTLFLSNSVNGSGATYEYQENDNDYVRYISEVGVNSWLLLTKLDSTTHQYRVASGLFSADLVNENDEKDTVKIRNGRFDVRF